MITMEPLADNAVKVHVSGKIDESDIRKLGGEADRLISEHGSIKVLVDATLFDGWTNMAAAEKHFTFVREHHKKVERIALVAGHQWQHWLAGILSVFVHPEIKVFDKDEGISAQTWLLQKRAA